MTATRSIVSRVSAGWRAHHLSVLAMLVVRTVRFASEMGRFLSHVVKARTASVLGIWSANQGLVVVGMVRRQAGSNDGGAGLLELFMSARWMGVAARLVLDWLGLGGVAVSPMSSPARWRFLSWVISCWESGPVVRAGSQLWICSAICWAAYFVFAVLSSTFPSWRALKWETLSRSMPRLPRFLSWVNSSVVNTTAAMSTVRIKWISRPWASFRSLWLLVCWYIKAVTGSDRGSHPSMSNLCVRADCRTDRGRVRPLIFWLSYSDPGFLAYGGWD